MCQFGGREGEENWGGGAGGLAWLERYVSK
jgi:hypothetical protein